MEEWNEWIDRHMYEGTLSAYDKLAELAVSSYNLSQKNRKAELKDKCQYFFKWWDANKKYMRKYTTYERIAELVKKDHTTVVHALHYRKPTLSYDENVQCLRDFLRS
jgi:hypothetical protein